MAATTDHPCFRQPNNPEAKLWRYMDFTKFVSLLASKNLFFCRSDLFQDPFEGSYAQYNIQMRPHVYKDFPSEHYESMISQLGNHTKFMKEWTYISCWHANEYESAAMWDLYAKTNEAVAIETNYSILKEVLPETVFLGLVNYIDYEREWLPEGNLFYPFMHKRKSFEHEKEVRALIMDFPDTEKSMQKNHLSGSNVQVDLNTLIKTVHVSPTAPKWFAELVTEIVSVYQLGALVKQSELYSEPVY